MGRSIPIFHGREDTGRGMVEPTDGIKALERRLYVVDDDPSIRRTFGRLGPLMQCSVETFESAEDFLEHHKSGEDRSVLVIDYRLPGMDGAQLSTRLREAGDETPVLFITAHEDAKTQTTLEATQARAVFIKPIDFKELIAAIEALLDEERP